MSSLRTLRRTAILIACKDGEATIGAVVASTRGQADVFVVSDGSTDRTVEVARLAGAEVLSLDQSHGKPEALRLGSESFGLIDRYDYIAVLDDDTTVAADYVATITRNMDADPQIAVASGRIVSVWNHAQRWNPYIAMRALTYWSYQATIKRGQNALRVVNVICGANSIFRAEVFGLLIKEDAPYAIDDMYWLAEIVRRRLGRVAYIHDAHSWTIDPHTFREWYGQTVRWSWGQFQSIRGHRLGNPIQPDRTRRLGIRFSWFDLAYLALLIDWLPYMLEPLAIVPVMILLSDWVDPFWFIAFYLGSSTVWICIGAAALRKPRLALLAPAIIVLDLVYRVTMIHATVKAIARPRVAHCKWDSPTRFALEQERVTPIVALTGEGSST